MVWRARTGSSSARGLLAALAGFLLLLAVTPANAQLLPEGFFDQVPQPGQGAAAVEADKMSYDGGAGMVAAEGAVNFAYQGYTIHADKVEYDQNTDGMVASGHVVMRDPQGNVYHMDSLTVTGGLKEAFVNSLTLTTTAGAKITARDAHYTDELVTVLTDSTYAPCGDCIDHNGQRIGWRVKATQITYDRKHAAVYMNNPTLEVLGIPIAWVPWLWIPDPTQPRATGLRMPSVGLSNKRGAELNVPYFMPVGEDIDILLSPRLMSRQGLLMRGDVKWRFPGFGEVRVSGSGVYQLDPSAFAGTVGDRRWRGALQTSAEFTPTSQWTVGWSYSAFSDNAFLPDYNTGTGDSTVDQLYATHVSPDTYIDARIQHFNLLGNYATDDPKQADALPLVEFDHVQDLAPGYGRVNVSGQLLGIHRGADQTASTSGVPYVYGYEGNKQHVAVEGEWENQWILPGGVTASPYLGARLDAAYYDRTTATPVPAGYPAQTDASLLSATPIAAMDVRWPLASNDGYSTQLFEPIAQLVYRGSSTTKVGITNDDAQSFVFDTSNLFSYNRFSGIDRQETGLRANIGGHYLGSYGDGSWLDLMAGQSFFLAGTNALGVNDAAQVGASTGLGSNASYIVASATGGLSSGFSAGSKVQVDPNSSFKVVHAGVGVSYSGPWVSGSVSYNYTAANPTLGTATDHEIATNLSVPVTEYWSIQAGYAHNLLTNSWSSVNGGATYDDKYFTISGNANATPSSYGFTLHAGLKGPDGTFAAF